MNLIDKRIYVLDPHYWQLDPPDQDRIKRDLLPLYTLLPRWVSGAGYWHCNSYGITEHAEVFELGFVPLDDLVYTTLPESDAPIAIMNIERVISGWPDAGNVDELMSSYRDLVACRIFNNRC